MVDAPETTDWKPAKQVYGLDFDDTLSADPPLWKAFIAQALARGHSVYIVTCRHDNEENRADIEAVTELPAWRHIYTGMAPKKWFCEQRGLFVSVWIDDTPECIHKGR